jgi:hypothetical protein
MAWRVDIFALLHGLAFGSASSKCYFGRAASWNETAELAESAPKREILQRRLPDGQKRGMKYAFTYTCAQFGGSNECASSGLHTLKL